MTADRPARHIFIGPMEIAGIGAGLAHGLAALGHVPYLWLSAPHPFAYAAEAPPAIVAIWQRIGQWRQNTPRSNIVLKALLVILHWLWAWPVLALALRRCEAFIFLYGRSITGTRLELLLIKALRRRIIVICLGSDARPPYMDGSRRSADGRLPTPRRLARLSRQLKHQMRLHEAHADYIVNAPSTSQFQTRRYIDWFAMGLPRMLPSADSEQARPEGRVRVLHSPSNPVLKGTPIILETIARLGAAGLPVDLVRIEKMPNAQVLRELASCDFVIDQLYSDSPMATFATEAAHFGKPAVVAGYFAAQMPEMLGGHP
ncbi:MAG: hypothetical protein ACRCUC_00915, partial [Aestuariivirga sp.]